jgi:hypothetical protein
MKIEAITIAIALALVMFIQIVEAATCGTFTSNGDCIRGVRLQTQKCKKIGNCTCPSKIESKFVSCRTPTIKLPQKQQLKPQKSILN